MRPSHEEAARIVRRAFDGSGFDYTPRRAFHVQWIGLLETAYGTWAAAPGNWGATTCNQVPPCSGSCVKAGSQCWETFDAAEDGARSVVRRLLKRPLTRQAVDEDGRVEAVSAAMKEKGYYSADYADYTKKGLVGAREIHRSVPEYQGAVPDPDVGFVWSAQENLDAAEELRSRLLRADAKVDRYRDHDTFPYDEWDDFLERFEKFYAEIQESWWSRANAEDQVKGYNREFSAWQRQLAKLGIKQEVPRPPDPDDDDDSWTDALGDSVTTIGIVGLAGTVLYFLAKGRK